MNKIINTCLNIAGWKVVVCAVTVANRTVLKRISMKGGRSLLLWAKDLRCSWYVYSSFGLGCISV
jgi:hypothetical protein